MAIEKSRSRYKAVFFDLDHTLWDFESNSRQTLSDLFHQYINPIFEAELEQFIRLFRRVNDNLWDDYNRGLIDKNVIRERRFVEIFAHLDIDDEELAQKISKKYLFACPRQARLLPNTIEILEYLAPNYELHILTNGFDDVQSIKLECSGINNYFQSVITSESAGHKKPALDFFSHALSSTDVQSHEVIMVGDNLKTDIAGAINASIDAVYFNPSGNGRPHKAHHEITDLLELTDIL